MKKYSFLLVLIVSILFLPMFVKAEVKPDVDFD